MVNTPLDAKNIANAKPKESNPSLCIITTPSIISNRYVLAWLGSIVSRFSLSTTIGFCINGNNWSKYGIRVNKNMTNGNKAIKRLNAIEFALVVILSFSVSL